MEAKADIATVTTSNPCGGDTKVEFKHNFPLEFFPENPHLSWLCHRLSGWQFGEQGLLWAIGCAINVTDSCIEYGAGDGESLPVTIEQFYNDGRPCVLCEIDSAKRDKLAAKYPRANVVRCLDWRDLQDNPADLAIIDIDGRDSEVMREMLAAGVRPSILVVEHMDRHYPLPSTSSVPLPSWALGLTLHSGHVLQDTAECLLKIAHDAGYERVGTTRCNSVFVLRELFPGLLRDIGSK